MLHQAPGAGDAHGRPFLKAMVWLTVLAAPAAAPVARADSLEGELKSRAPEVIRYLKKQGCTKVGVLKFLVRQGKGEATEDDAGGVNLSVANHLATALLMAQDPSKEDEAVRIIQHADATAARLHGAGYETPEGRKKLFEGDYVPMWGDGTPVKPVKADGFLTGSVEFSEDLRKVTVRLLYLNPAGEPPQVVFDKDHLIRADMDAATLAGGGLSFLDREAIFPDEEPKKDPDARAAQSAQAVLQKKQPFPLSPKEEDSPVQLEIVYGDKLVPLDIQDGKASIQDQRDGEPVFFRLKRSPKAKGRFGVVLLVNGVNTLYKQQFSADYRRYSKWVMGPESGPYEIKGFQKTKDAANEFKVVAPDKANLDEINFGENLGKITLIVFREKQPGEKDETDPTTQAIQEGAVPGPGAETLDAAQQRFTASRSIERGIIVPGPKEIHSPIQETDFEAARKPVLTAVITYYHPK